MSTEVVCERCDPPTPACARVAGHWYCLRHLRDLAEQALADRDYYARLVTLDVLERGGL